MAASVSRASPVIALLFHLFELCESGRKRAPVYLCRLWGRSSRTVWVKSVAFREKAL